MVTIFASCSENYVLKTDKENDNLKGNVKSVIKVRYKAVDKFGEGNIVKGEPYCFIEFSEYDSVGNYREKGDYYLSKITKRATHFYDKNGREYKYEYYDNGDDSKVSFGYERKFDNKGTIIEEKDLSDGNVFKYQAKYDNNGKLIYYKDKYTRNYYKYSDGNLIQHIEKDDVFENTYTHNYEYDSNGNMIKESRLFSGGQYYFFSKYDQFNRVIDSYRSKVDNPLISDIEIRTKHFYENDSVKLAYLTKTWDSNGKLSSQVKKIWFTNANDTTCILELDDNNNIYRLYDIHKDINNKIEVFYLIDSKLSYKLNYHYRDGKLSFTINDSKNKTSYNYNDKGELFEVIGEYGTTKYVTTYVKNKKMKSITYHQDSIESCIVYDYKKDGDVVIETETKTCGTNVEIYKSYYKEDKIIKAIDKQFGTREFFYNDRGERICNKMGNGDEVRYFYEYDSKGNWIKQISYKNGLPDEVAERSISYYN